MRDPETNRLYACRNDVPVYFGDYHMPDNYGPPAGYASLFLRRDGIYAVVTLRLDVDLNALKSCRIGLFAYNIVRNRHDEIVDGYIGYVNINASSNEHPIDAVLFTRTIPRVTVLFYLEWLTVSDISTRLMSYATTTCATIMSRVS